MPNYSKITIITALVGLVILPGLALAQATAQTDTSLKGLTDQAGSAAGFDTSINEEGTGIARIAGAIVRAFISLLGVLFISYTIYGGFLWMTAAGDQEKVGKAQKIIRSGIIGIIVVLSAVGIYWFVAQFFIYGDLGSPRDSGTATFF